MAGLVGIDRWGFCLIRTGQINTVFALCYMFEVIAKYYEGWLPEGAHPRARQSFNQSFQTEPKARK